MRETLKRRPTTGPRIRCVCGRWGPALCEDCARALVVKIGRMVKDWRDAPARRI